MQVKFITLKKILKKSKFTILGDINQNINPYYKYDNLQKIGQCDRIININGGIYASIVLVHCLQ